MKSKLLLIGMSCVITNSANAFDISLLNDTTRADLTPYIAGGPDSSDGFLNLNETRHFTNETPFIRDRVKEGDKVSLSVWDPENQQQIMCGKVRFKGRKQFRVIDNDGALVCQQAKKTEFKTLSWNVWTGPAEETPELQDHIKRVVEDIAAINPDVFLSIETYGKGAAIQEAMAKANHVPVEDIHYYTITCDNPEDQSSCQRGKGIDNLAVFSKYEIIDSFIYNGETVGNFNFGGVKINVEDKKTGLKQPVWVLDTWLYYKDDIEKPLDDYYLAKRDGKPLPESPVKADKNYRLPQAKEIIEAIEPLLSNADDTPIILAGDHNTVSHLDFDKKWKKAHYGVALPFKVSKVFTDAGFKDSYREIHPNPVLYPGSSWSPMWRTSDAPQRIDYIYYKGEKLQAIDSVMIDSPRAGFSHLTSDHGAMLTSFSLSSFPKKDI